MKKICLALVLSFVSVFSISAQTDLKSTENAAIIENGRIAETTMIADQPVKTTDKAAETNSPADVKMPVVVTEDKTAVAAGPEIKAEKINDPAQKAEISETVKKPEETKPAIAEAVKKPETAAAVTENKPVSPTIEAIKKPEAPVLQAKKYSLGALSTGNSSVDGYIEEFSELYDIDPLLIYAQMSQESSFRSRATSSKGASGYMQLMPDTARRFGVTNIYNPKQNIKAGVKYMRWLLDKFGGDMRLALAGYNAGEGSVMKFGNKIPPYRETQNYVAKIMNHYQLIANQNENLAQNEGPAVK